VSYKRIGKRELRRDGKVKAEGKALYPADIYLDDMVYGRTLRSTIPKGHFSLDFREALKIPGVLGILTAKDIPGKNEYGVLLKDHQVFCEHSVKQIGDPLGLVVAETEKIAKKAAGMVKVRYEEEEGVFDPREAMKNSAPAVHEDRDNTLFHFKLRKGNVEEAFRDAHVVVENTYHSESVDHAFLQTEAGVAYWEESDRLVIVASTQYPHFDRSEIANSLGLDEEKVRIINPAVGGSFGGREDLTLQIHLGIAVMKFNRPVKIVYDRKESFLAHCKRHPMIMEYKTAADRDGKFLGMKARIVGDTGAYASWAVNVLRKAGVHATGPYEIPNVWVDSYAVYTNNPFSGAMRGFGATQPAIAYEQQIDEVARKLGLDPFAIRRINGFKPGSITATDQLMRESVPVEECLKALENALKEMKTDKELRKEKGSEKNTGMKKTGKGIGLIFYGTGYGNGAPDVAKARAMIDEEGLAHLFCGASEVGQGAKTALTQIPAEILGLKPEEVGFHHEDTLTTLDAGTCAASRQTYSMGNAIKLATDALANRLVEEAGKILGIKDSSCLSIENYEIFHKENPNQRLSFKELAGRIPEEERTVERSFTAITTEMDPETGKGDPYWPYTFSACGVTVEVDTETGLVEILEGVLVQDAGKAVNPELIEGQMDGGFTMGQGYTLMEDLQVIRGEIKHTNFTRYLIPTALDTIELKKIIIEDPESTGPYGAKGVGEPVMIPVAPAILNAIFDAVGIRIKEIPVTPEKLLSVIEEGKHGGKREAEI